MHTFALHLRYRGLEPEQALVELRPRAGEDTLRAEDIEEYIAREGDRIALVLLGGINYYTDVRRRARFRDEVQRGDWWSVTGS